MSNHQALGGLLEAKIQCLMDFSLWPSRERLDAHGWMKNFTEADQPYAEVLLDAFTYYSNDLVDALFRSTVQQLSASMTVSATTLAEAKARWRRFLADVIVTFAEGEVPNPTDSGFVFARKARQQLGIDEAQIMRPADALRAVLDKPGRSLLLVDDFVGAGNQMKDTWLRQCDIGAGTRYSMAQAASDGATITYAPLVATEYGLENLQTSCSGLTVQPGYALSARYSLVDASSMYWPEHLKTSATDWLYETSRRAGIVDGYTHGWKGFHDLGLALAFDGSVPDATLPLFHWEEGSWTPLVRRT
jgi:hypothetical protein